MDSNINGGKLDPSYLFRRDASVRTAGAVTTSSGGYAIADTSTTAKVGDVYRAEAATTSVMVRKQYKVIEASTNSFTIASKDLPTLGDTFYILGPTTQRLDATGATLATIDTSLLATEATLSSIALKDFSTAAKQDAAALLFGAVNETAPATDTANSGANGRLQRIAQRLTSLLTELQLKADLTETQPVSAASLPLPSGAATQTTLVALLTELQLKADLLETQPVSLASAPLPTGAATETTSAAILAKIIAAPATETTQALQATAAKQDLLLAELQLKADLTETQPVQQARSTSATLANVASSATTVTLQVSNASRKGLTIFNDSTAILYVKFGATASTTSYTVQIGASGYYELPQPGYTGVVDGIWASANGNARMTEW